MGTAVPEIDWKYLRSVQAELLATLCESINSKAMKILQSAEMSEHDKYRALYQHMLNSDKIVAECFDDWRRSNIRLKVVMLYRNSLLTEKYIGRLSDETKTFLKTVNQVSKKK